MLRIADARAIADPTDDDKQEMRAAIGDNQTFARLSDANKDHLFCGMLTIRHRLQIYDELVKFEEEDPGPLLSALASLVAAIPNYHGLLTTVTEKMHEIRGISVHEAWRKIIESVDTVEFVREIVEEIAAEPRVYDKRTVRSRRQRHEAVMIRDWLKGIGVDLRMTGPDDYGREGDEGLALMARIALYTSGTKPSLHALRIRLTRAKRENNS